MLTIRLTYCYYYIMELNKLDVFAACCGYVRPLPLIANNIVLLLKLQFYNNLFCAIKPTFYA